MYDEASYVDKLKGASQEELVRELYAVGRATREASKADIDFKHMFDELRATKKVLADLQAKWSRTETQLNALERKCSWLTRSQGRSKRTTKWRTLVAVEVGAEGSWARGNTHWSEWTSSTNAQVQGSQEKAGNSGAEDLIGLPVAAKKTQKACTTK